MSSASDFRIISLVPSLTDLCFSLGLGHAVIGRTDYCISPAEHMPGIPSVGGPKTVDAKRFSDLKPTHVLICPEENSKDILPLIKSCNAVPILVHPKTPEDNLAIFDLFAQTFHCHDKANELSKNLKAALTLAQNMKSSTPSLCVLPLIWKEPWMTVSARTYAGSMLDAVGMTLPHTGRSLPNH